MSLKASWDDPLVTECAVIAASQGCRLQRSGRKWQLIPTGERRANPVAVRLTLPEIEALLRPERETGGAP